MTVGHTGFFRHPEQFENLRRALPELARRIQPPLRVWCAGCSTGEEAYSVALCADQACVPVSILATDVNPGAIEFARAGRYQAARAAKLPGATGGWLAPERFRQSVRFEVSSLIDADPSFGLGPFDLIFCRNVLIYFDREIVPEVLESLSLHLRPRGAIVISPADAVLPIPDGLIHGNAVGWLHRTELPPFSNRRITIAPETLGERVTMRSIPVAASPPSLIELAARQLSSGQLTEAQATLTSLLDGDPDDMAGWFLLGEVLMQRGEPSQARAAFRRANQCTVRSTNGIDGEGLKWAALRRAQC
jgi:chemotaxis protein methyltransferase CheR